MSEEYICRPVGHIRSSLQSTQQAPLQGSEGAPDAWVEIDSAFLRALSGVAAGDDLTAAVEPTRESIENGKYTLLARPVFIYVNKQALQRQEVAAFVRFYLSDEGQKLVSTAHCINLNADQLKEQRRRLDHRPGEAGQAAGRDRAAAARLPMLAARCIQHAARAGSGRTTTPCS